MSLTLDPIQKEAMEAAPALRPLMEEVGRAVWELAEVGLTEYRSAGFVADVLRREGFSVTTGLCGFPMGFEAEYKNGDGPAIALLCEYDALPGLSVTTPGGNGHGCGHNLFSAAAVATGVLVRRLMEKHGIRGTLRIYGTPGEENYASKAYYAKNGLFDRDGCSVGFHAHDRNEVNFKVSAGTLIRNFTFHGRPAHAGNCPWNGASALDAVEIFHVMVNYLREHVPTDVRLQYIITRGGDAPNIVPEIAQCQQVVRAASVPVMLEVAQREETCARAAAMATGTTVEVDFVDQTYNTVLLREYAQLAQDCLEAAGAPEFSPEELEYARQFGDHTGLDTAIAPLPPYEGYQGGATDEGDVSWNIPHVSIYVANLARNTTGHTLEFTRQANAPTAYTAMAAQVKAASVMVLELLEHPERVEALKAAHREKMAGLTYPHTGDQPDRRAFGNTPGAALEGDTLTVDPAALPLLDHRDREAQVSVELEGRALASFPASREAAVPLPEDAAGKTLELYAKYQNGSKQLIGYYNL